MGHMFLTLIDFHSKWLDARIMLNITSPRAVEKLKQIFSIRGLSRKIVTNNGLSFMSDEFKKLCFQVDVRNSVKDYRSFVSSS